MQKHAENLKSRATTAPQRPPPVSAFSLRLAASGTRLSAFTLVELITCISVGSIIAGSAAMLLLNASSMQSQISARTSLVDMASRACEQVVRYLRDIPQDAGLTGKAQITTADATDVKYGTTEFRLNGTTLEMTTNNGTNWYPVAKDVASFALSYTDKTGNPLTTFPLDQASRESVRVIGVQLTVSRTGESGVVRTAIYLRNFMNEVLF